MRTGRASFRPTPPPAAVLTKVRALLAEEGLRIAALQKAINSAEGRAAFVNQSYASDKNPRP